MIFFRKSLVLLLLLGLIGCQPDSAPTVTVPALGGTFNGGTSNDMTIYFEAVPIDALERVLWMESDRLGYFINTVTEPRMENEKQIVKNEKRQAVDNVPYGHTASVIDSNLYPETHPYNWQVIGSLADLQRATLADVRAFYESYYGPQNVTLESMDLIKEILESYGETFSEVDLLETKNAMIRRNFVNFETPNAQLTMLQNIAGYNLPSDYVSQREAIVAGMSVATVQALASRYISADQMTFLVVGDAATQLAGLAELGYGEPVLLDRKGKRL